MLHGYQSGWQGADVVSDLPVSGAMEALAGYVDRFKVTVYSSRSGQAGGLDAMGRRLHEHLVEALGYVEGSRVYALVEWPVAKPAAFLTIDDRAVQFQGTWPSADDLSAFQPWNKRRPVDDPTPEDLLLRGVSDDALRREVLRRGLDLDLVIDEPEPTP